MLVRLRAFPRIHIGLLDLGHATFRMYGGVGFALSGPEITIEACHNATTEIMGLDMLDSDGQRDVVRALDLLQDMTHRARIRLLLRHMPPQHVGLGSKTALILGILSAASSALGIDVGRADLQRLSGRGGTSGIGVNAFFDGGFIIDGGHGQQNAEEFGPSSARAPAQPPPIICRAPMPFAWQCHLLLPPGERISGARERAFFRRETPVPQSEALEAIALAYHGIAPAVITQDLSLLKVALKQFHCVGFKLREVRMQPLSTQAILESFDEHPSCAAGLSSMGPLVYVVAHEDDSETVRLVQRVCADSGAALLGSYRGRNAGYEVSRGSGSPVDMRVPQPQFA